MKKTILTTIALGLFLTIKAQEPQKKLPTKVTIVLTDKQLLRIDSAINVTASQIDSKSRTEVFVRAFEPLYLQVQKQMVVDSVKKK